MISLLTYNNCFNQWIKGKETSLIKFSLLIILGSGCVSVGAAFGIISHEGFYSAFGGIFIIDVLYLYCRSRSKSNQQNIISKNHLSINHLSINHLSINHLSINHLSPSLANSKTLPPIENTPRNDLNKLLRRLEWQFEEKNIKNIKLIVPSLRNYCEAGYQINNIRRVWVAKRFGLVFIESIIDHRICIYLCHYSSEGIKISSKEVEHTQPQAYPTKLFSCNINYQSKEFESITFLLQEPHLGVTEYIRIWYYSLGFSYTSENCENVMPQLEKLFNEELTDILGGQFSQLLPPGILPIIKRYLDDDTPIGTICALSSAPWIYRNYMEKNLEIILPIIPKALLPLILEYGLETFPLIIHDNFINI